MQHPIIARANANEHFNQMVKAAEDRRQAKKILGDQMTFWIVLMRKFQLDYQQNHTEEPSLLEGTS